MIISPFPPPQYRAIVAWLMIAHFLLQPLLAYWVTPRLAEDGQGRWVVMCTLNGTQAVYVDFAPGPASAADTAPDSDHGSAPVSAGDAQHCPALKLFQMAGSAQIPPPLQAPPNTAYVIGRLEQSEPARHYRSFPLGYASRAPPIA